MKRRILKKLTKVDEHKNFLGYVTDALGNVVVVPRMVRTPEYAEQQVTLSDGSSAIVFRCKNCQQTPIESKKLARQIKLAWIEEMSVAEKSMKDKRDVVARTKDLEIL